MATVSITGNTIRGATASKDNRTWQIRAVAYQPGGTGGGVITPGADWETLYPVDGVLTFTAEAGSVVDIKTPEGVPYRVRIPNGDAGLWDTIEAGVAYQPDTAQDVLNRAVANAAPGFIAAELGLQTADAITTDLDARHMTFTDMGGGEGYFSVGGAQVSGTLVPPGALWSSLAGRPSFAADSVARNGTTDDYAAIAAADDEALAFDGVPLMLRNGIHRVASDLIIDSPVWFLPGAVIKPDNGVTVTLAGGIAAAPPSRIFDESAGGTVTPKRMQLATPVWWGAVGDGTTDDTAALQGWLDFVVANNAHGWVPNGTYKITDTLVAKSAPAGYSIQGEHQNFTTIKQYTNNIPVLQIGTNADSTRSITLERFNLTYDSAQPSSNTNANCLVFQGPNGGVTSTAYGTIRRISFSNGYYAMKVPSGKIAPWATEFDLLYMQGMSGGFYDNTGSVGGSPNNRWGRITLYCDDAVGPIFKAWSTNNTSVGTFEFLRANQGQQLITFAAGISLDIGCLKLEHATYTTAQSLITAGSGFWINIGEVLIEGGTGVNNFNPASGTLAVFNLAPGSTNTTCYLNVDVLRLKADTLTGSCVGFTSSAGMQSPVHVGQAHLSAGWTLQNRGATTVGNYITVDSWVNHRLSDNKGDADYTVTLGDPNVVHFNTPFTAQRTITLPPQASNDTCNGLYYDLVFDGAINGSNTAVIKQGTTTLRTQTADQKILHYKWRRSVWVLVGVTEYNTGTAATHIEVTQSLTFPEVAAYSSQSIAVTVTGVSGGVYRPIILGVPVAASNPPGIVYSAFVSANNTVVVRANNYTGSPITPGVGPFTVRVLL